MTAAKKAKPKGSVKEWSGNQLDIAFDIIKKMVEAKQKADLYRRMYERKDGEVAGYVRFVDQESHREVLDVPVEQLLAKAQAKFEEENAGLEKWCGVKVVRE